MLALQLHLLYLLITRIWIAAVLALLITRTWIAAAWNRKNRSAVKVFVEFLRVHSGRRDEQFQLACRSAFCVSVCSICTFEPVKQVVNWVYLAPTFCRGSAPRP